MVLANESDIDLEHQAPRSLGQDDDRARDQDQPYERIRALGPQERDPALASALAPGPRCVIHRLKAQLERDPRTLDRGALRWISTYELAIARGDVKPCRCAVPS